MSKIVSTKLATRTGKARYYLYKHFVTRTIASIAKTLVSATRY